MPKVNGPRNGKVICLHLSITIDNSNKLINLLIRKEGGRSFALGKRFRKYEVSEYFYQLTERKYSKKTCAKGEKNSHKPLKFIYPKP